MRVNDNGLEYQLWSGAWHGIGSWSQQSGRVMRCPLTVISSFTEPELPSCAAATRDFFVTLRRSKASSRSPGGLPRRMVRLRSLSAPASCFSNLGGRLLFASVSLQFLFSPIRRGGQPLRDRLLVSVILLVDLDLVAPSRMTFAMIGIRHIARR